MQKPDIGAILLGVACYLGISGWLFVFSGQGLLAMLASGLGAPADTAAVMARQVIGAAVFVACGYITGRSSKEAPLQNAAILGLVLYVLATLLSRGLQATVGPIAPLDTTSALASLARALIATTVGGTIALWQARNRGAKRFDIRTVPRQRQIALLAAAIVPFVYLALAYRP